MTDHLQPKPDDWDEALDGPWDGNFDPADAADIELITSYLNRQLSPEHTEAVRKRLEEDADFRYLAEPFLLAWSVPTHLERHPRPEGEWERAFEDFKRRTGFPDRPAAPSAPPEPPPPPPSRWRRIRYWTGWKSLRVLVLLLTGAFLIGAQLMYSAIEDQMFAAADRDLSALSYDTGWIALDDGIQVQLTPGASLQVDHRPEDGMRRVLLDGAARFRVSPLDPGAPTLRPQALRVETRAGTVSAGESEFSVAARADTTVVNVHPLGPRRVLNPVQITVVATTHFPGAASGVALRDLDGARLVRGRTPQLIANPR